MSEDGSGPSGSGRNFTGTDLPQTVIRTRRRCTVHRDYTSARHSRLDAMPTDTPRRSPRTTEAGMTFILGIDLGHFSCHGFDCTLLSTYSPFHSPALSRLNGAIQEIERLTRALENHVEKNATVINILRHENNITRAKLDVTTNRIAFLEEFLEIEPDNGDREEPRAEEPGDAGVTEGDGGDVAAAARATNNTFKIWLGVTNLSKMSDLPGIPAPGEEAPLAPTGQHTGTRLVRFNWLQNATYPLNAQSIDTLTEALRAHGNTYIPGFGDDLEKIFDVDLRNRVITKFKSLATNWKRAEKSAGKARAPAVSEPIDGEGEDAGSDDDPPMDRKVARSRAKPSDILTSIRPQSDF
ncbi:uncharacterized protein BXZ73DRAFT_76362 [Epithele typhae]|uniref:uncharacterized protein n=1 Tax=Epithele typhae TaxID=378194 RepID=UPI0020081AD5|nr:uncharacterized protein BXZ73DRAFT_76362 [Epithele typhae]KAH9938861.1 hypothetical protein BXZ73DRAFT_76362 [Epithele typhae]